MNATGLNELTTGHRGVTQKLLDGVGERVVVAALCMMALACLDSPAATVTLRQNLHGYSGTKDAWLNESLKTRNYGGDTSLRVQFSSGLSDSTLLRFELPALNFQSIASATLWLYLYDTYSMGADNALEIKPYRIVPGRDWDENIYVGESGHGVNWRYRDNNQTLEWTGQNGAWSDKADDGNGSRKIKPLGGSVPGAIAPTNWVDWSVQPTVARWYAGEENNGFALFMNSLQGPGSIAAGLFYSRNNSDTAHRPTLVITYRGAELTWGGYTSSTWDTNAINWNAGGYRSTYGDGDFVTFLDGAANPAIEVTGGGVFPAAITVSNHTTAYSFRSGGIGGSASLVKLGAGQVTFHAPNSYAGLTSIRAGRLVVTTNSALGTSVGGTTVADGASLELAGVDYAQAEPLSLSGMGIGGAGALRASNGHNTFAGPITLEADSSVSVDNGSDLTLGNGIGGSFALTKQGAGTLSFAGAVPNTYSGDTVVQRGALVLAKSAGPAVPGNLVVGDGLDAATVRLDAPGQLASSGRLTVREFGQLDLNGHDAAATGLALAGGAVTTGTGTLRLGGDVASTGDAPGLMTGRVDLGGAARVFDVGQGAAANDLTVAADLRNGDLVKTGSGRLVLGGTNHFNSGVSLLAGVLTAVNDMALGISPGTVVVSNGARLELSGEAAGVAIADQLLALSGGGPAAFDGAMPGALCSTSGSNLWSGPVRLESSASIASQAGASLRLIGPVDAAGHTLTVHAEGEVALDGEVVGAKSSLVKLGAGALRLGGDQPNTYGGPTHVQEGALYLAKTAGNAVSGALVVADHLTPAAVVCLAGEQFGPGVNATIGLQGQLDLNGFEATLAGLRLNGGRVSTSAGVLTLAGSLVAGGGLEGHLLGQVHFAGTQDIQIEAGSTLTLGARASGAGFVKRGPGCLVLTNANTFDAQCLIAEGAVAVNNDPAQGSGLGVAEVLADGSAVLAGSGSIHGPLTVRNGATLNPGRSVGSPNPADRIGRLAAGNTVTIGPAGGLVIECSGPSPAADELDLVNTGEVVLDPQARLVLPDTLAGNGPYVVVRNARSIVGNFQGLPPDSPLPGQPGWYIHYGSHRVYFSQAQQPVTYFRAFSTNGVCLVMWRTAEEVETKSFDLFLQAGETWVPVNSEPIPAQNPAGAVYLLVNRLSHWNQNYRFRLVANTSSGAEAVEFERVVTELAFSSPPEPMSGGVVLRWFSRTDETYDLLGTADLNQPFQVLHTGIVATPPQCVLTNLTTWPQGYYWLRLVP